MGTHHLASTDLSGGHSSSIAGSLPIAPRGGSDQHPDGLPSMVTHLTVPPPGRTERQRHRGVSQRLQALTPAKSETMSLWVLGPRRPGSLFRSGTVNVAAAQPGTRLAEDAIKVRS